MFSNIDWSNVASKIFSIVIYPIITIIICKIVYGIIERVVDEYEKKNGKTLHIQLLMNILKVLLYIIIGASFLSQFDGFSSTLSALLTSSGILALGLSLAAQESATNLIDGFFLSIFHPFNVGDRVTLPEKDITGTITEMNLRQTTITTFNNSRYIISNSTLNSAIIENSSMTNSYSYPIDISITYDSDVDLAMKIMADIVANHPDFVDKRTPEQIEAGVPPVSVYFRNYLDSGIELRVSMVTSDVGKSFKACSDVRYQIKKEFDKQGISFPFPTVTISNMDEDK